MKEGGSASLDIHTALALRMKELAEERGKTPAEIGKLGGLRQSTISEILQGRSKHPKIDTITKYCQGCGISLHEFFQSDLFKIAEIPPKKMHKKMMEKMNRKAEG
ncbi:helix-turn-helix transcriptional regulator [Ureibacillus sp. FSL W7-1570]|uniref:helix-turn-helix domain-containing protein n=1 Tax=Ureibacillus sp. FSL W7-1570 TaxID=2954593 RepID=UPI003159D9C4